MGYAIYLRKSRADAELEAQGELETLSRHSAVLMEYARRNSLDITEIYKEIVSGETISARPVMQQLLYAVEHNRYKGVLVMEIERLARGDTIDQGIVAQAFKYSNTLIITPQKTYNPNNEFDEEYFEFGLFMSRREYKTINRRLQAGRLQSVKEGKFIGNKPPYGYIKIKLKAEKGYTLEPNPQQAETVRLIFKWYAYGVDGVSVGYSEIAKRLHNMGIKTATGKSEWSASSIRDILNNPVYSGKICWGQRPQNKSFKNGKFVVTRARNKYASVYKGIHPAIIDKATLELVQQRKSKNMSSTCPKSKTIKNPLAGLLLCKECGGLMQRRPHKGKERTSLICPNSKCTNASSDLSSIENAIVGALSKWLTGYKIKQNNKHIESTNRECRHNNREILNQCNTSLKKISNKISIIYDAYENGLYTTDIFKERLCSVNAEKKIILNTIERLKSKSAPSNKNSSNFEICVEPSSIENAYYKIKSPAKRNEMLKLLAEKIEYSKYKCIKSSKKCSSLIITIYPKLPQFEQ